MHDLLDPLHSSTTIPLPTLHTLHKLLLNTPQLLRLLPLLPTPRIQSIRALPMSYADPKNKQPPPVPCHLSYPFGESEAVAVAPSNLTTQDSNAGTGLFEIRPKRTLYAKRTYLRHLFASKGDFICSYHGPIRTPTECVT